MRSGKKKSKTFTPPYKNPETLCSNGRISQTTGRILVEILLDESFRGALSNGVILNKIQPVVSEILPFEHDVFVFLEGGVTPFLFSLVISPQPGET